MRAGLDVSVSLHVTVKIYVTLVNTQTGTETAFNRLSCAWSENQNSRSQLTFKIISESVIN